MEVKNNDIVAQLIDVHSHIQGDRQLQTKRPKPYMTCLCCSSTNEWDGVLKLTQKWPDCYIPCFGIHPWNAHEVKTDKTNWLDRIEKMIGECPNAMIGEIGVDKLYKVRGVSHFKNGHQQAVFDLQIQLALKLNRPINVHCVQAHGWLFDYFKDIAKRWGKTGPNILLHSFSGSADMIRGLTLLPHIGSKFYFSFSAAINLESGSKKLDAAIQGVPKERLLIESDLPHSGSQAKVMILILNYITKLRDWSTEETILLTRNNSLRFWGLLTEDPEPKQPDPETQDSPKEKPEEIEPEKVNEIEVQKAGEEGVLEECKIEKPEEE